MKQPILLFDLDGTLIDSTPAIVESFGVAFETHGGTLPSEEVITRLIGHTLHDMFGMLGIPEEAREAYVAAYKAHYRLIANDKTVLLPHAAEAVAEAASFARLGIVTTKTARYSRDLLDHLGIMEHFETLVGFEDVSRHKPDPEPILTALKRMEWEESIRAFMIGDTPMDIEAAQAAGIAHIAVTCGYADASVLRELTENVVSDPLSAVLLLRRHLSV